MAAVRPLMPGTSVRPMRDDVFSLTGDERRQALVGWRRLGSEDRRHACRLAKQGVAAPDEDVSSAARRYGEYLLMRSTSNRMPRWGLPAAGAVLGVVGTLVGASPVAVPGGVVVVAIGLYSWSQRRWGHVLVAANKTTAPSGVNPPVP